MNPNAPVNIPITLATRDAMVAEAQAEIRALQKGRLAMLAAYFLAAFLGTALGTSLALWFWLFRE